MPVGTANQRPPHSGIYCTSCPCRGGKRAGGKGNLSNITSGLHYCGMAHGGGRNERQRIQLKEKYWRKKETKDRSSRQAARYWWWNEMFCASWLWVNLFSQKAWKTHEFFRRNPRGIHTAISDRRGESWCVWVCVDPPLYTAVPVTPETLKGMWECEENYQCQLGQTVSSVSVLGVFNQ